MTHTCPECGAQLRTIGPLSAWITADGRVLLEPVTASPSAQRWIELPASAQNWLAEVLRCAHEQAQEHHNATPAP